MVRFHHDCRITGLPINSMVHSFGLHGRGGARVSESVQFWHQVRWIREAHSQLHGSLLSGMHGRCRGSSQSFCACCGIGSTGFARLPIHSMVHFDCMLTVVVLESAEQGLNLRSCGWISSVDHFSGSMDRCHRFGEWFISRVCCLPFIEARCQDS